MAILGADFRAFDFEADAFFLDEAARLGAAFFFDTTFFLVTAFLETFFFLETTFFAFEVDRVALEDADRRLEGAAFLAILRLGAALVFRTTVFLAEADRLVDLLRLRDLAAALGIL